MPNDLMRDYYMQRAGAGLLISEGTRVSPEGRGYIATPGIHSDEQVAGWRRAPAGAGAGLHVARKLGRGDLAYLHPSEPDWAGGPVLDDDYRRVRRDVHRQPRPAPPVAEGLTLNPPRPESSHGGDAEGYTDHPAYGAA